LAKPKKGVPQIADEQWHCYNCVTTKNPTNIKQNIGPEQLRLSSSVENTRKDILSAITNQVHFI